jgi:Fe2+ or Zn2+ uptake regulation protein
VRHDHHHHLVCDACGKVEPFADRGLERALEAVEERSGYSVVGHEVVVRGACADCRA